VTVTLPYPLTLLQPIGGFFGATFGTVTLSTKATMRTEIVAGGN
jgi:hypothetical protein